MHEMTMAGFLRHSQSAWAKKAEWMAIEVTIPNSEQTEIIIDRKESFDAKMKYYEGAYDENLVHKNVPSIKIVKYAFSPTFETLRTELGL